MNKKEAARLGGLARAKKALKEKELEIELWNKNPKKCRVCNKSLTYAQRHNKFCSHRCSAITTNPLWERNKKSGHPCLNCGSLTRNYKFCCVKCSSQFRWKVFKEESELSGIFEDCIFSNEKPKRYFIEKFGHKCMICEIETWRGQPVPLILDHIDGNAFNTAISNCRIVCPNCDHQLPTFSSRNKGNGRRARLKRMDTEFIKKYEKSIV